MNVEQIHFEGFFLSSAAFFKDEKFDDKDDRKDIRDNRTRMKCPTGPAGPSCQSDLCNETLLLHIP